MAAIRIGCGQITWKNVSETAALEDIAAAGYAGSPPKLTIERPAEETIAFYARYGLAPAPCYFGASFWRPEERDTILRDARRYARFVHDLGCTEIYLAAHGDYETRGGQTRLQTAGKVGPEDSLSDEEFAQCAGVINEVAAITLAEGVRGCFHNHVGTVIETAEELDRLMSLVDDRVFLGIDTGHLAWAGADVPAVCRRYADRIKTMHLKDIDEGVRRQGRAAGWDYRTFSDKGIFAELGEGSVDFPAILGILNGAEFAGWLIAETDVTQKPSARESATISRNYLRGLGL